MAFAIIWVVSSEVPVVLLVVPLLLFDCTTMDRRYLSKSDEVVVYVADVAPEIVVHVPKSLAEVHLSQE